MRGTWESTGSGGSGGTIALVAGAVILAAAVAGPVAVAAAELLHVLVVAVAVILSVALTAGAALVARRLRQGRQNSPLLVHRATPVTHRPAESLPAPPHPAIEAPREVHLHFHGVTAEDVAAIIARQAGGGE